MSDASRGEKDYYIPLIVIASHFLYYESAFVSVGNVIHLLQSISFIQSMDLQAEAE
jgi:hypothetical protein